MREHRTRLSAIALGLVVVLLATTTTGEAHEATRETSTGPLLESDEIDVPDRSRAFPMVAANDGCGTHDGGRFQVDGDPSGWTGEGTGINGTGRYDGGEYIWTDYPFDDAGTGEFRYPGEGEAGQTREDGVEIVSERMARYGGNAADIVELRVAADEETLYALVRLNFLNAVDSTVIGLGLDLDLDASTGFSEWPHGARLRTDGLDLFVTVHGTCGFITTDAGDQPLDEAGGAVRVDTVHNVMELAIPRMLLDGAEQVRLVGGAGLWDPAADTWMQPQPGGGRTNSTDTVTGARTAEDPAVFNLLFRDDEPLFDPNNVLSTGRGEATSRRVFQVARQSEVLRVGTTGPYDAVLDLDRLLSGSESDPMPVRRGDELAFTRQYRSRLDLEGLFFVTDRPLLLDRPSSVGNQLVYLSRYQPYGVYVPSCYEAGCDNWPGSGAPVAFNFHGGDGSHTNQLDAEAGRGVMAGLDREVGAITVAPLGRGRRQPWWRGPGELDVLEVLEDVQLVYRTDPDRRLATGPSLGGYATLRFASLYPDLWAGAAPHCPATYENSTSSRAAGDEVPQSQTFVIDPVVPGMLNVPYRQTSGTGDPLTRITSGQRVRDAAFAAELDAWYTEYPNSSHCFLVPAIAGGWMKNHVPEMADLLRQGRVTQPARVRYVIDGRHYPAGPEVIGVHDLRDMGIRYQGAYWVSELVVRPEVEAEATQLGRLVAGNSLVGPGPEVTASIDVASHARGNAELDVESCGNSIGFAGQQGGNPRAEPDEGGSTGVEWNNPNHWMCQAQLWSGAPANVVDLTVRNLAAATIDLHEAGLRGARVVVRAAGDGPLTVTFLAPGLLRAEGPCVLEQQRTPGSLAAGLDLSSPCELELRRGGG